MQQLILIIHLVACAMLIGLILIQQGKGAGMGASFGSGASQTLFGSRGATSFLFKVTAGLAFLFFVTSISLTYFESKNTNSPMDNLLAANPAQQMPIPVPKNDLSSKPQNAVPIPVPVDSGKKSH